MGDLTIGLAMNQGVIFLRVSSTSSFYASNHTKKTLLEILPPNRKPVIILRPVQAP
jgi:hypothetical protein